MIFYLVATIILIFISLNFVIIRPSRSNVENLQYTTLEDLWFKKGNKKLVIFLHGMYSTPSTFEEIAPLLLKEGWDVYVPALPASAHDLARLKMIGPWSWDESMYISRMKIKIAQHGYETVVLGGHSQGGSLAMLLAPSIPHLKALIIIASPICLYGSHMPLWKNLGVFFSGILQYIVPQGIIIPVENRKQRQNIEKILDNEGITYPLTLYTFKKGLEDVKAGLSNITSPLFLSYDQQDKLVNFNSSKYIEKNVSSSKIITKHFNTTKDIDPYGLKHQLLNYQHTKEELNKAIISFLKMLSE